MDTFFLRVYLLTLIRRKKSNGCILTFQIFLAGVWVVICSFVWWLIHNYLAVLVPGNRIGVRVSDATMMVLKNTNEADFS